MTQSSDIRLEPWQETVQAVLRSYAPLLGSEKFSTVWKEDHDHVMVRIEDGFFAVETRIGLQSICTTIAVGRTLEHYEPEILTMVACVRRLSARVFPSRAETR